MSDALVLGDYRESFNGAIVSKSSMNLSAEDLLKFWRRCSLSSDFYAQYFSLFFPKVSDNNMINQGAAENSISFLLNELFENAAKFSNTPKKDVSFGATHLGEEVVFQISNYIKTETMNSFKALVEKFLSSDTEKLYLDKLEENAMTNSSGSGLGYLTLMNDYGIKFGYKFEKAADLSDAYKVTIQATLKCEED